MWRVPRGFFPPPFQEEGPPPPPPPQTQGGTKTGCKRVAEIESEIEPVETSVIVQFQVAMIVE